MLKVVKTRLRQKSLNSRALHNTLLSLDENVGCYSTHVFSKYQLLANYILSSWDSGYNHYPLPVYFKALATNSIC
jgi:hypothetical protein